MTIFLRKLATSHTTPIEYQLKFNNQSIPLNAFLNKPFFLEWTGEIHCIQCNRAIKKSFQQGYCFPCMQKINECNNCMIHPEKCLVETGNCDPADWAHAQCHQQQLVYLANSSGLKVGITQIKNNPTRWIDQGAIQALPIFQTSNRYQAGLIEVGLKEYIADKTNWRAMLMGNIAQLDLLAEKKHVLSQAEQKLAAILKKYSDAITILDDNRIFTFEYPVITYPKKIISLSFDKTSKVGGILLGIKGQYLIFDSGVINIRKFGGYQVVVGELPSGPKSH